MIDNWQFKELDSSLFKAFLFAARELNFTRAGEKAAMTQSGVSQQVGKLEQQLGQQLFLRVNKSVSLTEAGRLLQAYIERQQDELERLFEGLGTGQKSLSGPVRYAMPHSCLFTPHFPMLLKARKEFSGVELSVNLCANEDIVQMLLAREIDFGFLTRRSENPALQQTHFAEEEYVLVGKKTGVKHLLESLHTQPFVDYPGMQNLFEVWKQAAAPAKRNLHFEALKIKGRINSLNGAITMLTHGVGFSIVPRHVVEPELKKGQLEVFHPAGKKEVRSQIFIGELKEIEQPARVQAVLDAFYNMK